MRVLLVEDNARLQNLLAETLNTAGFGVDRAGTIDDLFASAASAKYDVMIVDLGLPDGDALDAIRVLRAQRNQTPILVITARASVDERVAGLDSGADDYLTKPFNNAEFLARVRALVRRQSELIGPIVAVGNTSFNSTSLDVVCNGAAVDLRFSERRLLMLLMRRVGSTVPKEALEASLSEFGREMSANAIEAIVSRSRRALIEAGSDVAIETVRGVGYTLKGKAR